jgi:hypothetical protein
MLGQVHARIVPFVKLCIIERGFAVVETKTKSGERRCQMSHGPTFRKEGSILFDVGGKVLRKGGILVEAKPLRQIFETTRKDLFHISQFKVSINYEYPEDVKLTRSPCQHQFTPTSISQGLNPN